MGGGARWGLGGITSSPSSWPWRRSPGSRCRGHANRASWPPWTSQLNEVLDTFNRGVNFQVDDSTEEMYVQIVDRNSGEVLKSIPSKELLAVMARIHEVVGMMVDIRG